MRLFHAQNKSSSQLGPNEVWLFVFVGESNSGGRADNADLTTGEKASRSGVQIWNPNTSTFQNLDIETNNLIGHSGLSDNAYHGWENGLAHKVEDATLPNPVYLVKCGQGGSQISEWDTTDSYYTTMVSRIDAAQSAITGMGKTYRMIVWYSLGLNDLLLGNNEVTWKSNVQTFFSNFRAEYGSDIRIIMTEFMSGPNNQSSFNDSIVSIASADVYTKSIPTDGLYALEDDNHWSAAGMKDMAATLVSETLNFY